jgi:mannose-6-phosphate isomerase
MEKDIRPWGRYEVLLDSDECKVKRLWINSGHQPSYQYHHKRSETWVIVKGQGLLTLDDVEREVTSGEVIFVPCGVKHRLKNIGEEELIFIEVQTGEYFGEDDIVRLADDYKRE